MSKTRKINAIYDAPVTITFVIICFVLFALNEYVFKQQLTPFLTSPTSLKGVVPFNLKAPLSYCQLICYCFGSVSLQSLCINALFVLLLGPSAEERYGSVVIGIMILVAVLFSGVLNACFGVTSLKGCDAVVMMLVFLNALACISKSKISISSLLVLVIFLARAFTQKTAGGITEIIINAAGGLCGSLFAFMASPKAKAQRKASKEPSGLLQRAQKYNDEEKKPARTKKEQKKDDSSTEETVIGTLKF